ncbi:fibronectin type III domain-containing protein [Heyndrickxia oleronia]|uniref:fibronectin type III domain-containing protein n=1 Tax=Heyndrickxia oleronia TaxID=38875 RepID=UPI0037526FAC
MRFKYLLLFSILLVLMPFNSINSKANGVYDGLFDSENPTISVSGRIAGAGIDTIDNNLKTFLTIGAGGSVSYVFQTPHDIKEFSLLSNQTYQTVNLDIMFYDSGKNLLNTKSLSTPTEGVYSLDKIVKNVSSVVIKNKTSNAYEIYEFDLGVQLPIKYDDVSEMNIVSLKNGVQVNFKQPLNNSHFVNAKLYKDGDVLANLGKGVSSFIDYDVESFKTYTYKITSIYDDDTETVGVVQSFSTEQISTDPIDQQPPEEISNLKADIAEDYINFTFDIPPDEDFDHVNIYKNGVVVGQTYTGNYHIENLEPETEYSFKFTTVDMFGNESNGVVKSFTTLTDIDTTPPSAPTGVKIDSRSNGLIVTYKRNTEKDLAGYNIYVDSSKHNASPVTSTSYTVPGLDTDSSYSIYVTAVDKSGNESEPSEMVIGTTSSESLPLFEMGFSLADVAVAVSNWFDTMWLIVAFAVAIPLAFYIAARTKILFLD